MQKANAPKDLQNSRLVLPQRQHLMIIFLVGMLISIMACSGSTLFFHYGYNVRKGIVYYKPAFPNAVFRVEDVDAGSFKEVSLRDTDTSATDNGYYAIDKQSVFYQGYRIEGSDGPSFQLLDVNRAKDKNQCYFRGSIIKGADPQSFVIKDEKFSSDAHHVFMREVNIDDDNSIFESFNEGKLVHTKNAVIVYDASVPVKQGASFRYLSYNYFSIDGQVYSFDDSLPGASDRDFEAIDNFFSKTGSHVYYLGKIIIGADPKSFRLLESPYSRDRYHVYFFERLIEGADVASFEIVNLKFQCARDKHAAYYEDKKINKFTHADLVTRRNCTNCDESGIYFADSIKAN